MSLSATVELTHDDGSPLTLRDDAGCLWRVVADAGDATYAVEEIDDYGGGPAISDVKDRTSHRPGVARWDAHGPTLTIYPTRDVGENHTDPTRYELGCGGELVATPTGWETVEEK
jgi:hypothetical protein